MQNPRKHYFNESGVAHLGLILIVLVVFGVGGFAAHRVITVNNDEALTSEEQADKEFDDISADTEYDVDEAQDQSTPTDTETADEGVDENAS